MRHKLLALRFISSVALFGVTMIAPGTAAQNTSPSNRPKPSAPGSLQDTMLLLVDPSADALWESVGTIITKRGTEHRAPHTDAQWRRSSRYAQSLIAGAQNLQRRGLKVAANPQSHLADYDVPGSRTAAQIRADIDANPSRFLEAASQLEEAANLALTATRNRDAEALFDAGGAIDSACEHCHQSYWYPRQNPKAQQK